MSRDRPKLVLARRAARDLQWPCTCVRPCRSRPWPVERPDQLEHAPMTHTANHTRPQHLRLAMMAIRISFTWHPSSVSTSPLSHCRRAVEVTVWGQSLYKLHPLGCFECMRAWVLPCVSKSKACCVGQSWSWSSAVLAAHALFGRAAAARERRDIIARSRAVVVVRLSAGKHALSDLFYGPRTDLPRRIHRMR
jgi:hypothetical protein